MRIFRIIGLVAFFFLSLVVGIYLTFPWDALEERLTLQLSAETGWKVSAERLEPSWLTGVRLEGLRVQPPDAAEPLLLDEVVARARLLSLLTGGLGGSAWIPIGKGEIDVTVARGSGVTSISARADSVELGLVPGFASFTGLPMSGELDLEADVTLDQEDASQSSGELHLVGRELEVGEGGKVANYPVPALRLGDLDWTIEVDEGRAEIPRQELRGGDVDLDFEGTVDLATPFERTTLNLTVAFKPTPQFLSENSIVEVLLNNIRRAKGADGFYSYAVSGSVKHPRTFPRRR